MIVHVPVSAGGEHLDDSCWCQARCPDAPRHNGWPGGLRSRSRSAQLVRFAPLNRWPHARAAKAHNPKRVFSSSFLSVSRACSALSISRQRKRTGAVRSWLGRTDLILFQRLQRTWRGPVSLWKSPTFARTRLRPDYCICVNIVRSPVARPLRTGSACDGA